MKNTKILLSLAVCGIALGAAGATVDAAFTTPTDGSINWKAPTGPGEIIKPEVPGIVIDPGEGGSTEGPLRMEHVPAFNFGTQEIQAGEQVFNPLLTSYKFTGTEIQPGGVAGKDYYMPHFIQITDLRGTNTGWDLFVSATKFKNGTEVLDNAKITLNGTDRLSNTVYDLADIKDRMLIFNNAGIDIPMDGTDKELVMGTKDNEKENSTNGTKTSLVLDQDYLPGELVDYKEGDVNSGVTFTKAHDDVAVIGTYVSTITWELTDGK